MSDVETRTKVADLIKDGCPLRSVLKEGKACPYFGASKTCRDCSYSWEVCADGILKLAKSRRALYEKEKEKVEALEKELREANEFRNCVGDILVDIQAATSSFRKAFMGMAQLANTVTSREEKEDVEDENGEG